MQLDFYAIVMSMIVHGCAQNYGAQRSFALCHAMLSCRLICSAICKAASLSAEAVTGCTAPCVATPC